MKLEVRAGTVKGIIELKGGDKLSIYSQERLESIIGGFLILIETIIEGAEQFSELTETMLDTYLDPLAEGLGTITQRINDTMNKSGELRKLINTRDGRRN